MKRTFVFISLLLIAGCSSNPTPEKILEAVQIKDNQCGTATITGNMDIGGTLGFFGTTVTVNIDKSKRTYIDSAGVTQDCP